MRKPAISGRTFAAPSSPVGKLGRVQAPKGVFLRVQPAPDAASPIPGDRMVLEMFGQSRSLILNSRGARNIFDQSNNTHIPDSGHSR